MADDKVLRPTERREPSPGGQEREGGMHGRQTSGDPGTSQTYLGNQGMQDSGLNPGAESFHHGAREGGVQEDNFRESGTVAGDASDDVSRGAKSGAYGGPDSNLPEGESVYTDSRSAGNRSNPGKDNQRVDPNSGGKLLPPNGSVQSTDTTHTHGPNPSATKPSTEGGGDVKREVKRMPPGQGKLLFRCKDAGQEGCPFELRGNSEDEMLPKIEQHARETHNIELKDQAKQTVRDAIRRAA